MILQTPQTQRELRSRLRPMRAKIPTLALTIFAADAVAYSAAVWAAMRAHGPAAWAFGTLEGVTIAMLFIVGHDACHGSFTASPRWNRIIGMLAFLPSATPFRAWRLGHNHTHHVYTNLKPLDRVWTPLSKREYDALPPWRRLVERVYRSAPGMGLYYGAEIWWKHLFFARDFRDSMICSAYAVALGAMALSRGWEAFAAAVVWPFVVWNWVMGWATFEHHTHPDVPWFDDPGEWRAAQAQTRCAVHIVLPRVADAVLHRIMQHTAHHLDVTVPLYGLAEAQRAVESHAAAPVVVYRWTPLTFLRHLRQCKLYDFERRRWTGFDGPPVL